MLWFGWSIIIVLCNAAATFSLFPYRLGNPSSTVDADVLVSVSRYGLDSDSEAPISLTVSTMNPYVAMFSLSVSSLKNPGHSVSNDVFGDA